MICVQIGLAGSNYSGACAEGECTGLSGFWRVDVMQTDHGSRKL